MRAALGFSRADADGNWLSRHSRLPDWLYSRLLNQMISRSPRAGDPGFVGFPEAKFLISDDSGNVYLFYYVADPVAGAAVRYQPQSDTWTRLGMPANSLGAYMLANAFAGAIVGDVLYVSRDNGTIGFRIVD